VLPLRWHHGRAAAAGRYSHDGDLADPSLLVVGLDREILTATKVEVDEWRGKWFVNAWVDSIPGGVPLRPYTEAGARGPAAEFDFEAIDLSAAAQ
jgi:hypothetical protein